MKYLAEKLFAADTAGNRAVKAAVNAIVATACIVLTAVASASAQGTMILQLDGASDDALSTAIQKVAEEAYQLNVKGLDALEKNDLDGAMEFFNRAIAVFPQYTDALNNRGVVLYRRGNVGAARGVWEDVVRRDPQYHAAYYNIGLIHLHDKKPDEAMKQFELALKQNAGFTEAMLRIGSIHLRAGRTAAAVDQFARAYRGAPDHQDAWNFYSYGLLVKGDTAAAVTVLKRVGDNAAALAQLGRIEAMGKRHGQAAEYFAKAVRMGAPPSVALELATAQVDAGKCGDALATLSNIFAKEAHPAIDVWLLAGFAAKECGGNREALEYYNSGLIQYPRDPLLLHNAGQIYFSMGDHAKAEEIWNSLGDARQDPQLLYKRAISARSRNDPNAAERHIRSALSLDEKAEYHDFLGVLLGAKGDAKGAEEHFRKALRIDPNLASAQLNLAARSRSPADLERAAAEASKRLSSCKNNCGDAALQLSILYYHQKNIERALSTLESLKDADKDARVYRHIAVYGRELRRDDKVIAALEAAAAKFKSDVKLRYELAEAYLSAGMPSKAIPIFQTLAPKWKDDVWRLHYQLGYAYKEMNDLQNAKAAFEKSLAAKKDNPAARALLAFVLNRMGETAQAVAHWEATAKEDGNNAAIHINLGLSYENKGEYGKALESYRRAQMIDPNDKALHINLGNAFKGLDRASEAFDAYNRGLESNKREVAAYNIFFLARQRGDNARAERMYELLRKEFPSSPQFAEASAEWERVKKIDAAKRMFEKGDFRGAYAAYAEIAGGAEAGADAYVHNMILSAHNAGMHVETIGAAGRFADRVKDEKSRAEIFRVAGNSAIAMKNWAEAKNQFTRLSALEPNNAVAHYNLAVAHYNLGEVEAAHERYQRARRLDGKIQNRDIELRYEQFKRGNTQTSAAPANQRRQADSLDIWYNQAVDLQNARKVDQAEALYKKILARDSTYGLAWNNLGAIHGARGDLNDAEAAYLKALESDGAPETFANLANIYVALEEFAKARDIIAKGLVRHPKNAMLTGLERQVRAKTK